MQLRSTIDKKALLPSVYKNASLSNVTTEEGLKPHQAQNIPRIAECSARHRKPYPSNTEAVSLVLSWSDLRDVVMF